MLGPTSLPPSEEPGWESTPASGRLLNLSLLSHQDLPPDMSSHSVLDLSSPFLFSTTSEAYHHPTTHSMSSTPTKE
ncbi:hypothetical protein E2C01_056784 [Portunus trituberculatus]|uniref:Uncharacterized protein n=1 Tax=Portunus trituberculatus TaxID=210409 RepID=A0A5B7GZ59_PORTR|nr:hypothetical protein [Portunus trituberculatus]